MLRTIVRAALVGLELFTGIGAGYGAVMLVTDAWHLPVSYLDPLPVHGWLLPGVALFVVVAVPMLGSALFALRRSRRTADAALVAGLLLVGWILFQLLVIGPRMVLQPVMLGVGLATAALGAWWRRAGADAGGNQEVGQP